ncbi:MAG TPA: 4Fe-4S dicluster domain-containing protein [Spirochaetota bacterium]|nr:4Fe-4S dicluster domain-containing protein [Spirochaetota bacterium]HSA13698.1 4Fe-4S dicluster domain-containing protein [Spirochaetota bacterium]
MTREKYSLLDRLIIPDYDTPGGVSSGNLKFDTAKCKECGICISICPGGCLLTDRATKAGLLSGAVKGGRYGVPRVDKARKGATLCIACYDCGAACPHGAISIETHFDPKRFYKRLTQTADMTYPVKY